MKKYLLFLLTIIATSASIQAQTTFNFASAPYDAVTLGYLQPGVGEYFKSTGGGTTPDVTTVSCDGFTPAKAVGSNTFVFQASSDYTNITLRGTSTASSIRTLTTLTTSATLNGTYVTATFAQGTSTIGTTCGVLLITPTATIPAGTFVKFVLSGNMNVTSIVYTPAISGTPPTVTTNNPVATSITQTTATLGGQVTAIGSAPVTVSGIAYDLTANPTTAGPKSTDGPTAVGAISSAVSGLQISTTYHARAYATNSNGTSYGADQTFTTLAPASPTISASPSSLSFNSQTINTTSAEKTFSLSAFTLSPSSGNLVIVAPAGYEVSATTGTGFASTINIPYTSGALSATTIYVHFIPTALIAYNGNITIDGGGAPTANVGVTGTGSLYTVGDYMSAASGNWGTAATWNKWNGTAWVASVDFPNATTVSVFIDGGFVVNDETSGRSIYNLFIQNGSSLKSSNKVNSPIYLKVYGSIVSVNSGCTMGAASAILGDAADGLSIDYFGTGANPTLTFTGTGGNVNLSRVRTNTAGTTVIFDLNMSLNYHGSTNTGNAGAFYTVAGDNNTLTVNAGKTLTFTPWACYFPVSGSHTNGTSNETININGTMTFMPGNAAPDTVAASRVGFHSSNYMSLGVSTKTVNLNIGGAGILNVTELYPQGTKSDNSAGTGDVVNIAVAAGGAINVTGIADFRKPTQTVSGGGTFTLMPASTMKIGSPDGITTSAALGNIQTATRNYSSTASYAYMAAAGQATGNGLPSPISGFVVDNVAGITLSNDLTATDSIRLVNGILATGTNKLTAGNASNVSRTNGWVNGNFVKPVLTGTSTRTFEIGDATVYAPALVTFNLVTATGQMLAKTTTGDHPNIASSTVDPTKSVNRYWTLTNVANGIVFATADVTLNWVAGDVDAGATPASFKVGKYDSPTWSYPVVANPTATSIQATGITSFSDFVAGQQVGPLAVSLEYFKGYRQANNNNLVWKANVTTSSAVFSLERSADGRSFGSIGNVNAASFGTASVYGFVDGHPLNGINYYRLKTTEADGHTSYSMIIAILNTDKGFDIVGLSPTLVNSRATLSVTSAQAGLIDIMITDINGKQLQKVTTNISAGSNTLDLDFSKLASGMYQLTGTEQGATKTIRFVKL